MAVSSEQVRVAKCDACKTVRYGRGDEPIIGFHGTVTEVADWGSDGATGFFACKEAHIGRAARAVLTDPRSRREPAAEPDTGERD